LALPKNSGLIPQLQKAIREEGLDGWLFCNFRHRDALSDAVLQRPAELGNSRFWFYAVPGVGEPLALVHAIEADHLDGLPGIKQSYTGRTELLKLLAPLGGKRWGGHVSRTISAVSYLDAGMYGVLCGAGIEIVPAEGLVQRFKGVLDLPMNAPRKNFTLLSTPCGIMSAPPIAREKRFMRGNSAK